ncbi:M14 family metallopeptidase [Stieleria sp. TO1_6]|nr:M14 family metallopeptidase [Stieleria tagensis]
MNAAGALDATITSYAIDSQRSPSSLAIDVATLGPDDAPALVLTSAVHGIEGFFGSAVQLALLERFTSSPPIEGLRYVLVHGINPFGFDQLRRFTEDNVDLNRNFKTPPDPYRGVHSAYRQLDSLINPLSPPGGIDLFVPKALWYRWRLTPTAVQHAISCGQFEYPQGLFYGGSGPAESAQIVQRHCDQWIGKTDTIVHLDLHTALGPFATYKLLLCDATDADALDWYETTFGADSIEPAAGSDLDADRVAFEILGQFGSWMQHHFHDRDYRFMVAEFGTYSPFRVLKALRAENRGYHYGYKSDSQKQAIQGELLECFCPRSPQWRQQVLASALDVIDQATTALEADR